jgi:hypothetical protein
MLQFEIKNKMKKGNNGNVEAVDLSCPDRKTFYFNRIPLHTLLDTG